MGTIYKLTTMSRLVSFLMVLSLMVMVVIVNTQVVTHGPGKPCPDGQVYKWSHVMRDWICRKTGKRDLRCIQECACNRPSIPCKRSCERNIVGCIGWEKNKWEIKL